MRFVYHSLDLLVSGKTGRQPGRSMPSSSFLESLRGLQKVSPDATTAWPRMVVMPWGITRVRLSDSFASEIVISELSGSCPAERSLNSKGSEQCVTQGLK